MNALRIVSRATGPKSLAKLSINSQHTIGMSRLFGTLNPPEKNTMENFIKLQEEILDKIKVIPEHVQYHKNVMAFTSYRLKAAQEAKDLVALEAACGAGDIDDLINQAEDELQLIPKYAEWKLWEVIEAQLAEKAASADSTAP